MCGRFTLTVASYEEVARALELPPPGPVREVYRPRFNVAPTDPHWIVCWNGGRAVTAATWGFRLSPRAPLLINARAESAARTPAFSQALRERRCAVPTDGFYEWTGPRSARRPFWFHRPDRRPFTFAGLYRERVDRETGEIETSFTILTCAANGVVAPYHDRMPVLLAADQLDTWLAAPESPHALLQPPPDDALVVEPVSRRVGDPRHDDPDCLVADDPATPAEPRQRSLF